MRLTDPEDVAMTHKEIELIIRKEFEALLEEGVDLNTLLSACLLGVWRFLIATSGSSTQASVQLSNVFTQLLAAGPRIEAEQRGDSIH
jgi:hypothetical protein